ncbi:hypothetical protein [Bradyrhizobium jicamae]|uniref:hypothetical protein n=1 Tax=Bradyrhizobium jicamae TaxID=280332 RepID=UPI001BA4F772|nr:hypothetical protein [Bradyrhizobium jicamae]MBR0938215.1 hypothetical protein [Bradyrhizobium jicamae]
MGSKKRRRRVAQVKTLEARLLERAKELRDKAAAVISRAVREALVKLAGQAEAGARMAEWLRWSPHAQQAPGCALKFGRTSAPRLPHAEQMSRGSTSDKSHIVSPAIGHDGKRVTALEVGAIDQDAANADRAHVAEGDLLGTGHGG